MKKRLFIYGAGGLGREYASVLRNSNEWLVAGFIDDVLKPGKEIDGIPVVGNGKFLQDTTDATYVILAFGDPGIKARIVQSLHNSAIEYPVIIHPTAILQDKHSITIGKGTVICAGTVLTVGIKIGEHVLLNLSCTIGHDAVVGHYTSIMPGCNIAGNVVLGSGVLVGSGSNIRNMVRIGDGSTIGMGSVVISDIDANVTVAGVPAKKIGV